MAGGIAQQCYGRTIRTASTLLPIAERVHAGPHRLREPGLRQSNESPQRGNILSGLEVSKHETLAHARRDCRGQLFLSELKHQPSILKA